jgi:3-oxoacyl-(acyl-carrier-protein) synthase
VSALEVVVTGAGVIAPGAAGIEELCARLVSGEPASEGLFPAPFPIERFVDAATVRKLARVSELAQLAIVASKEALARSGSPESAREETGVFFGTCFGPAAMRLDYDEGLVRGGLGQASPLRFTESVSNAASAHVSRAFTLHGPGLTVLGGEDAGLSAIVAAFDRIASGGSRAIVAGGAEERARALVEAIEHLSLVGRAIGKPFGPERARFFPGAAALVLESRESARARGARPLARVAGAARARGERAIETAAREAIAQAGRTPEAIEVVVGGASGGEKALAERRAIDGLAPGRPYVTPHALFGEGFAFTSALAAVVATIELESRATALVLATTDRGAATVLVLARAEA